MATTIPGQDAIDPALVDLQRLAAWMDDQGLPGGDFESVEQLAGGTQNILLRFRRGGRGYVLRRPPKHLRKASNDVIRRESVVLAALTGADVPSPGLIAACPDADNDVLGVVFYLMEPIDGFNPTTGMPAQYDDESWQHRVGLDVIDGIADLGAVDHVAVGLDDFGKPEGFLERQVPRWLHELDTFNELEGYPGPEIPELDRVAEWLDANRPTTWTPGVMHGDYHLANVLFSPHEPKLAAIVDWEMSTIGDPLIDLGWMIAMWPDGGAGTGPAAGLGAHQGFPKADELVARYAQRTTRDMAAFDWYVVVACFKLGIILEGTHARAFAGKADKAVGDLLHATTLALFAKAATYL